MRRLVLALVTIAFVAGGVVVASAQQTRPGPVPAVLLTPAPPSVAMPRAVPRTHVVDRILSFDIDGDDRVTADELPERMQHVMTRGDQDGDGFLTAAEIDKLVERTPGVRMGTAPFAVKPFTVIDVVSDLRLPQPKRDLALALAKHYAGVRNINDSRSVDATQLNRLMRELLDDEEYENFVAAAARMRNVPRGVVGGTAGGLPTPPIAPR